MNRRRNAIIVLGCLGLLLVVALLLFIVNSRAEFERVRGALAKSGERLRPTEIVTNLPPSVSNGIRDLLSLSTAMPDVFGQSLGHLYLQPGVRIADSRIANLPAEVRAGGGRLWVSNVWDAAAPYFETNRHAWDQAVATLTNDVLRTHLDWSKGFAALSSSHLMELKRLAAWSAMAVPYELRRGDHGSAIGMATDGFRILGKYEGDPTLIGMMTRSAMFTILGMRTWLILQHQGWSDDQLQALQKAISAVDLAGPMLRGIEMERAMVLQLWEQMVADPPSAMGSLGGSGSGFQKVLVTASVRVWSVAPAHLDMSWYLERFQEELDSARSAVAVKSYDHFMTAKSAKVTRMPSWWQMMSKMVWLDFTRTLRSVCQAETFREMQVAAIALERHKLKTGRYPARLKELVPDFLAISPIDWMDGRELRYRLLPDGSYRLWSVGADLKDQGGDPSSKRKGSDYKWEDGLDWVWPSAATPSETERFIKGRRQKWLKASQGTGSGLAP